MKKVLLPALMVVAMMTLISCGDVGTTAPTGSAPCENEVVDYLYKGGIYDTNTDALKQIMGNWSASPETYGVIGAYLPNAPNEDSLYHKIADSTYPVWVGTSVAMQYGILGSLGEFTGYDVATRMSGLLQALGTNQVMVTNQSAKSIVDAINSTIGAYYPGTDGYTGILGVLSDPAHGVMASLGSGLSYQSTIKGLIEDTTGPPGTGTPSVLPGLMGAIDNSGASRSLAEAILNVYIRLSAKVGNQTIPVRAEGQGLCQWIESFAPGGSVITDSVYNDGTFITNMDALKSLMGDRAMAGPRIIHAHVDGQELYQWIDSFPPCENEVVDYLYKGGICDTNTDALKQIMGNWSSSPETYGVIGAYLPNAPNEDSLYHKIADSTYPVWVGTSVAMQYGILGSLGEFTGYDVATRMSGLLQALGTNQVMVTNQSAKSIVDAINSTIGAYYPGTDGYTGILGVLSDPAHGVMASLGSGLSYQSTIKSLIEDTTGPPGTGTPSVLPGLMGAIDNSGASRSLAEAILNVYIRLSAKVGNQTIPVRTEGQGLCQWIDSFAPNP